MANDKIVYLFPVRYNPIHFYELCFSVSGLGLYNRHWESFSFSALQKQYSVVALVVTS